MSGGKPVAPMDGMAAGAGDLISRRFWPFETTQSTSLSCQTPQAGALFAGAEDAELLQHFHPHQRMAQGASLLATWASRLGFGAACAAAAAARDVSGYARG